MPLIDWLTNPNAWASFIALSAMEIVLGIDNVVFISLLVSRLPADKRLVARRIGLSLGGYLAFEIIRRQLERIERRAMTPREISSRSDKDSARLERPLGCGRIPPASHKIR
jgi:hypothetical protein